MWEGQLWLAVKDGSLRFLFENKGDIYNGHGFEMLVALSQHVVQTWFQMRSLLLCPCVNDVQGQDEPIVQY
jgi:hypothetical protein